MTPLLSIIIPLYNKQDYILKTIDSVLSQECNDYEIVIVDDGSTDNSVNVVEHVLDQRIHLFHKENGGPSSARNFGVDKARGEWVIFLDADDVLEPGAITQVVRDLKKHKRADVFCYNLFIRMDLDRWLFVRHHKKGYLCVPFLHWYLDRIYPRTGNMVCRKSVMLAEPYCENYRRWEDGENTFRLMRKYRFYASPIPLFTYCCDNVDASKPCRNPYDDYICNMKPDGKSLFEQLAMYKLYKEACICYPDDVFRIYGNKFNGKKYKKAEKVLNLYVQLLESCRKMKKRMKKYIKGIVVR